MRRGVMILTVLALCAACTTPAAAQVAGNSPWFVNAGVGPSFGTFGSTPVVDATLGFNLSDRLSIGGEFGALPHARTDKVSTLAPSVSPVFGEPSVHVNAYHTNVNLFVRPYSWGRLQPYATAGFGAFTGATIANGAVGTSQLIQYDRQTNPAENVGAGAMYRLNKWLGVTADYRHFIVNADETQHVNRFTTGVALLIR